MIARIIAVFLLLCAILTGGAELAHWIEVGHYDMMATGDLWNAINSPSLAFARSMVERYLGAWVWDPFVMWGLDLPAWSVLGIPAIMVLWLVKPRPHPRFLRRGYFL